MYSYMEERILHYIWGAHCCHLANTIELSVCSGDAVFCQITLTICLTLQSDLATKYLHL